jgi:hypothetical protein
MLHVARAGKVVQTNAVCFSTPKASDLKRKENREGLERGIEIFSTLLEIVNPQVLVVHGVGTIKFLKKYHKLHLPAPPRSPEMVRYLDIDKTRIFVIPSLAAPQANKWLSWSHGYLNMVTSSVVAALKKR